MRRAQWAEHWVACPGARARGLRPSQFQLAVSPDRVAIVIRANARAMLRATGATLTNVVYGKTSKTLGNVRGT
jgi:hypothetical protein